MTIKEFFKSAEAIVTLTCFTLVYLTGWKLWAVIGFIGYIVTNVDTGLKATKSVFIFIKEKVIWLYNKIKAKLS